MRMKGSLLDELRRSVSRPTNKHTNIALLPNYLCQKPP